MVKSTLVTLFRLLKSDEVDLLDQLIDTPLFKLNNRHTDTVRLFRYLKPLLGQQGGQLLPNKKEAAQSLFGHRSNPDTELRKAMSNLVGIFKKFVLMQQLLLTQQSPVNEFLRNMQTETGLLQWIKIRTADIAVPQNKQAESQYYSRKNRLLVDHQYRTLCEQTAALPPTVGQSFNQRNYSEWLLADFWKEYEMFDYFALLREPLEQEKHMIQALAALDQFYYQLKMTMVVHLQTTLLMRPVQENQHKSLAQNQIIHGQFLMNNLPEHLSQSINLEMYATSLTMLLQAEQGEAQYQALDQILGSEQLELPDEIIETVRSVQRIYCAQMYNRTGNTLYLQRNFIFFTENLERDIRQQGGAISALSFSAAISNALRLGSQNHDWVRNLLNRFKNGIGLFGTETPREVYKINRAHLLLQQRAFREAANELVGYEWYGRVNEPQILLLAIRIDLKTQIEMGNYDEDYTLRTLDNAEKRIFRLTGIDEEQRQMTMQFLRLIKQIGPIIAKLKIRHPIPDLQERKSNWLQEIAQRPVAEKGWLMEKIENLGN